MRAFFAARSSSRSPRTRPTTSASRATCVEGRGLVSDAIWSYQTPPLVFPRPAFEVWLPLPTFLAAIPMALLGATFAGGAGHVDRRRRVVAVLAWRLAADVADRARDADERAPDARHRHRPDAAVYLPLLLHCALPDSTMPFTVLALARACS